MASKDKCTPKQNIEWQCTLKSLTRQQLAKHKCTTKGMTFIISFFWNKSYKSRFRQWSGTLAKVLRLLTRLQQNQHFETRNTFFVMKGLSARSCKASSHVDCSITLTSLLWPRPHPLSLFAITIFRRSSGSMFSHSFVRPASWYHFRSFFLALWHFLHLRVLQRMPPQLMVSAKLDLSSQSTHLSRWFWSWFWNIDQGSIVSIEISQTNT